MKKFKKPLFFMLALIPVSLISAAWASLYQLEAFSPEMIRELTAGGSVGLLVGASAIQTTLFVCIAGFFGYILSDKLGLWNGYKLEPDQMKKVLLLSAGLGILLSLDYWTFGSVIPGVKEAAAASLTTNGILASIFYGGIIEEILMRLFTMSLIAFAIWKIFFGKREKEEIPVGVFIAANVLSALLFAAGHLPLGGSLMSQVTPMVLIRCLLINGGFGMAFGYLYRKHGIWYAMLSHAVVQIISKVVWLFFL